MGILYLILGIGQLVNLFKYIKLASRKPNPGSGNGHSSDNALMQLMAAQHQSTVQTECGFRFLGLFLFYGAIWGWIDIFRYFSRKNE